MRRRATLLARPPASKSPATLPHRPLRAGHLFGASMLILFNSSRIERMLEKLMTTQAELAQTLADVSSQVAKIGTETQATLDKVAALEAALAAAGSVSAEVQAAVDALKAQVQVVDDLVADAP